MLQAIDISSSSTHTINIIIYIDIRVSGETGEKELNIEAEKTRLKLKGSKRRKLTENEAERVSERSLTPHQAPRVDSFCGAVDVSTADPGRRHREYPYEKADRTAGKHHLLLRVVPSFLLPCRPYSNS